MLLENKQIQKVKSCFKKGIEERKGTNKKQCRAKFIKRKNIGAISGLDIR